MRGGYRWLTRRLSRLSRNDSEDGVEGVEEGSFTRGLEGVTVDLK